MTPYTTVKSFADIEGFLDKFFICRTKSGDEDYSKNICFIDHMDSDDKTGIAIYTIKEKFSIAYHSFEDKHKLLEIKELPSFKYVKIELNDAIECLNYSRRHLNLDYCRECTLNDVRVDKKILDLAITCFLGRHDPHSILSVPPKEILSRIVYCRLDIARNEIELFFDRLKSGYHGKRN